MHLRSLTNITIRTLALGGKFILSFYLASKLDPGALGLYGLLSSSIGFLVYLVGIDFYVYATREILLRSQFERNSLLKSQAILYILTNAVGTLFICAISVHLNLSLILTVLASLTLLTEHLAQEASRTLIASGKQQLSVIIGAIRSGLWCYVLPAIGYFPNSIRISLDLIFIIWITANSICLLLSIKEIYEKSKPGAPAKIDWHWIRTGLKTGSLMLFGTICLRSMSVVDRYILESSGDRQTLGVYTLLSGIAAALPTLMEVGFFIYHYPKLIQLKKEKSSIEFDHARTQLYKLTYLYSISASILISLTGSIAIHFLPNPLFAKNIDVFIMLIGANLLFTFANAPHYSLYATSNDKEIVLSNLTSALIFPLICYPLSKELQALGTAIALTFSAAVLLMMKTYYASKTSPKNI